MSIMCVLIAFMCGEKKALKTLQKFFEMVDPIHPNERIPTQIKANMYSFHFIRECIIAPCYYVLQRLIKLRICECVILDKIWDKKTKDHVLQMIQESGKDLNEIRDFKDFRVVRKALDTTQYMESSRGLDTRFSGLSRCSKFVMFSNLIQDVFETIVDYGMRPKLRNHNFFVDSGEPLPTRPNDALRAYVMYVCCSSDVSCTDSAQLTECCLLRAQWLERKWRGKGRHSAVCVVCYGRRDDSPDTPELSQLPYATCSALVGRLCLGNDHHSNY